jgi:2-polyprenyl-6-methoxyphenol hydroxylase-like FAD-dependent oxidoreductase
MRGKARRSGAVLGKHRNEVLVVGAGPTGLYTALRLAGHGVQVAVVDKHWRTGAHSYALALHPRSLRLLHRDGLAAELVDQGHRVDRVVFWIDGRERGALDYSTLGGDYPFALVLPQSALEGAFEDRLSSHKVKINWNHRLESLRQNGDVLAEISHLDQVASGYPIARLEWTVVKTIRARAGFVVAADGYHSHLRERLGISYEQSGPLETFSVFEFESSRESGHEMRVVFEDGLGSVFWPMKGNRCRWSFQITHPDQHEPSRARLNDFIDARASWFPPVTGQIYWSSMVQFDRRQASGMGRNSIWLAGDAAHLSSPVGVQSMNTGLVDAYELSSALVSILRENGTVEALERYERNRLQEIGSLFGEPAGLKPAEGAEDWVRRLAPQILRTVPATAGDLEALLAQIGLKFEAPTASEV